MTPPARGPLHEVLQHAIARVLRRRAGAAGDRLFEGEAVVRSKPPAPPAFDKAATMDAILKKVTASIKG